MNTRRHQTGFGLIEVLVSLLIVSIGLLGIAALEGVRCAAFSGGERRRAELALALQAGTSAQSLADVEQRNAHERGESDARAWANPLFVKCKFEEEADSQSDRDDADPVEPATGNH